MRSSLDEAMALLKKWKSEGSRVAVLFDGRDVHSSLVGSVLSVSEEEVCILSSVGGPPSTKIRFRLTAAALFEYAEPQEAAEVDRERLGSELVCSLKISFESGERCFLHELVK